MREDSWLLLLCSQGKAKSSNIDKGILENVIVELVSN